MEAKSRLQPSRPPEGTKGKEADKSNNWRSKRAVSFDESEDEGEVTERDSGRATPEPDRVPRIEMPYKGVTPVNIGARLPGILKPVETKEEKAYRVRAPIQRDGVTEDVIDQIHNTEVTIKLGDLFGLSRELREGERLQLTKVRQPPASKPVVKVVEEASSERRPAPEAQGIKGVPRDALNINELPKVGVFVTTKAIGNVPVGSLVAEDPYLQYLESLPDNELPKPVYVARESVP